MGNFGARSVPCWGSWTIYKNCLYCIALMCYSVSVNKFAKEVARLRIIIKILLFPIVLALTLLVAFCRFFCLFSGMVLGIVAFLLFLLGIVVLFAGRVDGFIGFLVLAWLVSPYGLPLAASWLTERVADFNHMLKSI